MPSQSYPPLISNRTTFIICPFFCFVFVIGSERVVAVVGAGSRPNHNRCGIYHSGTQLTVCSCPLPVAPPCPSVHVSSHSPHPFDLSNFTGSTPPFRCHMTRWNFLCCASESYMRLLDSIGIVTILVSLSAIGSVVEHVSGQIVNCQWNGWDLTPLYQYGDIQGTDGTYQYSTCVTPPKHLRVLSACESGLCAW